MTADV